MIVNHLMLKRGIILMLVLCLSVCIGMTNPGVYAQTMEVSTPFSEKGKSGEIKLAEGLILKSEDVENARIKAEEVKAVADKSTREIESFIANLKSDAETNAVYLEKLQHDKKIYQAEAENPKILELLNKEIDSVKEKIDIDNEQIETYEDRITALQDQSKVYAETVVLLKSILRMEDTLSTSYDQAPTVRKEAEIAKNYIVAVEASIKEKESVISFFSNRLEEIKDKTSKDVQDFVKYFESVKEGIEGDVFIRKMPEIDSVLRWKRAISAQWITIFEIRLKTATIRYDKAQQELKNAKYNAAFLAEKAKRLEERLALEELQKKQAELEAAKKVEEASRKVAERTKVEVEKALQEAAKKGEEVALKQMMATSPEKKRTLELEAEVHKQVGLVAKKKDELIAVGTQRYRDVTEFKELEADIGLVLSEASTSKEIDEFLIKIEDEIKRFLEAITAVESLIPSVKEEEKLVSDNLAKAKEEIAKIEKEATSFEDKELATQAVKYAHQIVKALGEQRELISTRLDRLQEQLEIKKNALALLQSTKEKLINMQAANVWTRIESNISTQTLKVVYKDFVTFCGQLDQFYSVVQTYTKSFISYVSHKKRTSDFWVRSGGLIALVVGFYFLKRFIRRWCNSKIRVLYEAVNVSYYKSRLLPSLLIVFQRSLNALWLVIISVSLPAIFNIKIPLISATIYVLTFIAVHRVLKGFLIESLGPEKGSKKLVTSLAYVSPTHLYKSLNIILLFSLISLSIIAVLTIFEYRSDVIELLWFIYRVGILILLLWLATQRTFIFKLLPSAESQFGRLIHRIIMTIYPIFITFVVFLFAIRTLGYPVLTYVLLKTCIKSFVIAFIAFWVWKYLHHRLNYIREMRLKRDNIKKGTPEEKRFHTVTEIYHASFNYVISIIAAVIIIRVWIRTFHDAVGSSAAPYLVQKIFGHVGTIFRSIGNGLRYRFFFEEGRYTTPIKIIIALIVLLISFFVARYIKKLLEEKVFNRLRLERGLRQTFSTLTRYIIIGIAALIGLNLAGIPLRSLAIFAGAFGIGIGFGMQNIISNFVSGIILLFERPMRIGDVITLEDGTLGTVEKISARSTTMYTPDGITVTVPNSKFIESRITNWTHPTAMMRGCVKVGVAYGSDTALVKKCLLEVARQNQNVKTYPEPFVRFAEFGESALLFELYFWSDDPGKRWFNMSDLNFAIDEVFRKNNIEISFPQRDIRIRSVVPFPVQNKQEYVKQEDNEKIV